MVASLRLIGSQRGMVRVHRRLAADRVRERRVEVRGRQVGTAAGHGRRGSRGDSRDRSELVFRGEVGVEEGRHGAGRSTGRRLGVGRIAAFDTSEGQQGDQHKTDGELLEHACLRSFEEGVGPLTAAGAGRRALRVSPPVAGTMPALCEPRRATAACAIIPGSAASTAPGALRGSGAGRGRGRPRGAVEWVERRRLTSAPGDRGQPAGVATSSTGSGGGLVPPGVAAGGAIVSAAPWSGPSAGR